MMEGEGYFSVMSPARGESTRTGGLHSGGTRRSTVSTRWSYTRELRDLITQNRAAENKRLPLQWLGRTGDDWENDQGRYPADGQRMSCRGGGELSLATPPQSHQRETVHTWGGETKQWKGKNTRGHRWSKRSCDTLYWAELDIFYFVVYLNNLHMWTIINIPKKLILSNLLQNLNYKIIADKPGRRNTKFSNFTLHHRLFRKSSITVMIRYNSKLTLEHQHRSREQSIPNRHCTSSNKREGKNLNRFLF